MDAKRDSTNVANTVKMNLITGTKDRSPENLAAITKIAGFEGNKAANKVRVSGNIPTVSSNTSRSANESFVSDSNERSGSNVNINTSDRFTFPSRTGGTTGSGKVYRHPVFSVDGDIKYKREGNLYIDSIQMKPLKMSYQGNRNK